MMKKKYLIYEAKEMRLIAKGFANGEFFTTHLQAETYIANRIEECLWPKYEDYYIQEILYWGAYP